MIHGITTEIDWKHVGAKLANLSDHEQADFFKGFVKECLSWGTRYQAEGQLAHINHKLSEDEKELLSMITYIEGATE